MAFYESDVGESDDYADARFESSQIQAVLDRAPADGCSVVLSDRALSGSPSLQHASSFIFHTLL